MKVIDDFKRKRRRKREKKRAEELGNFWIPCPRCGEEFGAHEWEVLDEVRYFMYEFPNDYPVLKGLCGECCMAGHGGTMPELILTWAETFEEVEHGGRSTDVDLDRS